MKILSIDNVRKNIHTRVNFPFNNSPVNAGLQGGTWNHTLVYSLTNKFGSASVDLSNIGHGIFYNFTSAMPVGAGTYVSCFVYLSSTPSATAAVWCLYADANNRIYLFADTSKRFKVTVYSGGGIVSDALYSTAKSTSQWYYVQVLITCSKMYLFVNKELITYTLSSCPSFSAVNIGVNTTGTSDNIFTGLLDSLTVQTRTTIPISTMYNLKNREC